MNSRSLIFYFLVWVQSTFFVSCVQNGRLESIQYGIYLDSLKKNLVEHHEDTGDGIFKYRTFNGRKIGTSYRFNYGGTIENQIVFNNDYYSNWVHFYDSSNSIYKKVVYSSLPNKQKEFYASEIMYIPKNKGDTNNRFSEFIKFDKADTLFLELGQNVDISFSLSEGLGRFNDSIIVHATNYSPYYENPENLDIEYTSIKNNVIKFTPIQFGFVRLRFTLIDQLEEQQVRTHTERYIYIIPEKFKAYDWSFIRDFN